MFDNKLQTVNQNISNNNNCIIIQTGIGDSDTVEAEVLISMIKSLNGDSKLLNKLVKEQISVYEEKIYENDYSSVLSFCNALFSFNTTSVDQVNLDIFHWLQFVSAFYTNNTLVSDAAYENLCESDKELAGLLLEVKNNPKKGINITAINKNHVFNITVLRVLFDAQEFSNIIKIKDCFNTVYFQDVNNTKCLQANICYLIGLSCFNCQMFEDAIAYLSEAYEKDNSDNKHYFCNVAKITHILNKENLNIQDKELLKDLYMQCESIVENKVSIKNDNYDIWVILNLRYFLCIDIDSFEAYYSTLPDIYKNRDFVIYYNAQYFIAMHEFDRALEQLEKLENSEQVRFLEFLCYLHLKKYEEIVASYEGGNLDVTNILITGIYLEALRCLDDNKLDSIIGSVLESDIDSVSFVAIFGIVAENKKIYDLYFKNHIVKHLKYLKYDDNPDVINMILHLALKNNDSEVADIVLENYKNNNWLINETMGKTIYIDVISADISDKVVIDVSTKFIDANVLINDFLLIRSERYYETNQVPNALYDIEIRYNNLADVTSAEHAVVYMMRLKEFRYTKYEKYVSTLIKANNSCSYSILAVLFMHLQKVGLCKEYAYKCLYLADNNITTVVADNYFRSLLGFASDNDRIDYEKVEENTVVYCRNNSDYEIKLCLEKGDFYNGCESNTSLNIKHIGEDNPNYYKYLGLQIGEQITFENTEYKIVKIVDKNAYALWYMQELHDKEPKKFGPFLEKISVDNPQEMIQKLEKILESDKQNADETLRKYHFEEPAFVNIGLPLDCVSEYGYNNYVRVVRYLLFNKGEALYTGTNDFKIGRHKYVFTLSTLVVLSLFGWLDIFEDIKEGIILPESFVEFINNCRAKAYLDKSKGFLHKLEDGRLYYEEKEQLNMKVWEEIYEKIYNCKQQKINEEDRKEIIIKEDISLESILTGFRIDISQFDCILLAKKENITLVCDDLFLRKVCALLGVDTVNTSYLLSQLALNNDKIERIEQLAKSNYLYLGYDLIMNSLIQNKDIVSILLDGDRKSIYYLPYLDELKNIVRATVSSDKE